MTSKAMKRIGMQLAVTPYGKIKDIPYDLVILPWGATEPHNYHLPYLTDCILSEAIALDAAAQAEKNSGIKIMVLPPVAMGSQNPGQRNLPFCIHYRQETQRAILTDIVASLYVQGIRKLVVINGHGGNSFKGMIRDLAFLYPDFLLAVSDWYTVERAEDYFEEKDDHAGELETSVLMYYHPELVRLENAGNGRTKSFGIPGLNEKVAWVPRDWSKVSEDSGIGNPRKATAEKGGRFARAVTARYAGLFRDLVHRPLYEQPE